MNKNQKTYLLLFIVALVWGAIGYQLYSHYNPDTIEVSEVTTMSYTTQKVDTVDGYEIQPDYRDPFLGKIYRKQPLKKKVATPKHVVIFPAIVYKGIIEGGKKTYIIAINGSQEIFRVNQTIKEVTLLKADGKSILLKYQNERKKYALTE